MRFSLCLIATLATNCYAAPAPMWDLKTAAFPAEAMGAISDWFNAIATKVPDAKVQKSSPPVCDLSRIQMPMEPGLATPSEGLVMHHVAVGRGTQNYTCDTTQPASAPKAAGAVATLFNATCLAAMWPDMLEKVPGMAVHFSLSDAERLGPVDMLVSGHHYFLDAKTPYFDLNTAHGTVGQAPCAKDNSTSAPTTAATGQAGEPAVSWLKLITLDGATDGIKEVFRTTTAGGSPPTTCDGMADHFEIQYSAVYWFWAQPTA